MTKKKETGGSAFPNEHHKYHPGTPDYDGYWEASPGMTLRDWFAGMALQGILGGNRSPTGDRFVGMSHGDAIAATCYELADAMLKARQS